MKITKEQLRKIIKEESSRVLSEKNDDQFINEMVIEMKRILGEIKFFHDTLAASVSKKEISADDLINFEEHFQTNVRMNFPWMISSQ